MEQKQIVFTEPWKVETRVKMIPEMTLGPNALWVKRRFSLVSPGTELACLSGQESWFPLPGTMGYTAISEVLAVGSEVRGFVVGDRVFHYGKHQSTEMLDCRDLVVPVTGKGDERFVPFARLATIAMTALRVSDIELGDVVIITGLGLVGNLAAQWAHLSGATVVGIDPSQARRDLALSCGIDHALDPKDEKLKNLIQNLSMGRGASTLIEASGVPAVLVEQMSLLGKGAEAILLGSPRGEHPMNVTDLLNQTHLWGNGCITLKGAHEWRLPLKADAFHKHSFERNTQIALSCIEKGQLNIAPLLTHTFKPEMAPKAYEGLRQDKERFLGVVFDWT